MDYNTDRLASPKTLPQSRGGYNKQNQENFKQKLKPSKCLAILTISENYS